ncbi:hypothetical protein GCM10027047_04550 [Rhodococcus aerolatus]
MRRRWGLRARWRPVRRGSGNEDWDIGVSWERGAWRPGPGGRNVRQSREWDTISVKVVSRAPEWVNMVFC